MSTLSDLLQQQRAIEARIAELRELEKADALAKIKALADEFAITHEEAKFCFTSNRKSASGKTRSKRTSSVLYVNPNNSKETYNGNGRHPAWLKAMSKAQQDACKQSV
jgi:DNA-binding protein H-NS